MSGILLVGGILYFSLSLEHFEDLQFDLAREKKEFSEQQFTYFTERNASNDEISSLLTKRSKLRQEEDDFSEKIQTIEEEGSFLGPKLKRLEDAFVSVNEEAEVIEKKLADAKAYVEEEIAKKEPFQIRISELTNEIQASQELLEQVKLEVEDFEKKFSQTSNIRKIAHKSFLASKELLLAQMVKPNYLFYDDRIEVFIENVSPSNIGFFSRNGTEDGFKSGFRFLASEHSDFEQGIHYIRCKLAEQSLSFFEIENNQTESTKFQAVEGQKLYLIRTGDFPIDNVSATPAEPD